MNIKEFKNLPKDSCDHQRMITNLFLDEYLLVPEFVELRTFVEENAFGFGEKVFYPFHKMIIDDLFNNIIFLEIGVFRGQTLALMGLLSNLCDKEMDIYGVTPLDSTDGHWESDYAKDIHTIHNKFNLTKPNLIVGLSTDHDIIHSCSSFELDVLYIDGGHTADVVTSDIVNYSPLVKKGGYMIIDDSANNIIGTYWGEFWGIQEVSDVVDSILPPTTENFQWEYIGNVLHNRAWKRI